MSIRTLLVLIVCLFPIRGHSDIADLFKSCDEQWVQAWDNEQALNPKLNKFDSYPAEIPKSRRPDCEPKDVLLKNYFDGREGYARIEEWKKTRSKANEDRQKRISTVLINGYYYETARSPSWTMQTGVVYSFGATDHPDSLVFTAKVTNKGIQVIQGISLDCDIDVNNATKIYSGDAYIVTNLIPGGTGTSDMFFHIKGFADYVKYRIGDSKDEDRFIMIGSLRDAISDVSMSCEVKNVNYRLNSN